MCPVETLKQREEKNIFNITLIYFLSDVILEQREDYEKNHPHIRDYILIDRS